jgi:hypothetical protein
LVCHPKEECKLRRFENRVQRKIFGAEREEIRKPGENCYHKSFIICALLQILLGWAKSGMMRWVGHVTQMEELRNLHEISA